MDFLFEMWLALTLSPENNDNMLTYEEFWLKIMQTLEWSKELIPVGRFTFSNLLYNIIQQIVSQVVTCQQLCGICFIKLCSKYN